MFIKTVFSISYNAQDFNIKFPPFLQKNDIKNRQIVVTKYENGDIIYKQGRT